jgi:hypothetical protein
MPHQKSKETPKTQNRFVSSNVACHLSLLGQKKIDLNMKTTATIEGILAIIFVVVVLILMRLHLTM